ncbi:hypothetical protein IFO70_27005 [Phormidium tenue FACHB-886]|nr:hypothetical protein [Phormidium tenue FACHB-886]
MPTRHRSHHTSLGHSFLAAVSKVTWTSSVCLLTRLGDRPCQLGSFHSGKISNTAVHAPID